MKSPQNRLAVSLAAIDALGSSPAVACKPLEYIGETPPHTTSIRKERPARTYKHTPQDNNRYAKWKSRRKMAARSRKINRRKAR